MYHQTPINAQASQLELIDKTNKEFFFYFAWNNSEITRVEESRIEQEKCDWV
jgi:hypothetical protein